MCSRMLLSGCVFVAFVAAIFAQGPGGGTQQLVDCVSGCSDTHHAEYGGNNRCKVWSINTDMVTHCRWDSLDLAVTADSNDECVAILPHEKIKEWSCDCEEMCKGVGDPNAHREMRGIAYGDIGTKCTGTSVERDRAHCQADLAS